MGATVAAPAGRIASDGLARLVTATEAQSTALAVEKLFYRMTLTLARPATWAAVGADGTRERGRILSGVTARATDAGRRWKVQHAALDPYVFPLAAPGEDLVLLEALATPLLDDLLLEPRRPTVVLSAAAPDWMHGEVPWEARTVQLPGAIPQRQGWDEAMDEILQSDTLSRACALAEWGIPVPLRAIEPSSGGPADLARLESTGLFIVEDSPLGPLALAPSDAAHLLGRRPEWRERRADLLEAVVARLTGAEDAIAVALVQKLLRAGQERLGRQLAGGLARQLGRTDGSRALAWARVLRRAGVPAHARMLLDQALARTPRDRALRRERALVLHALDRTKEGQEELARLTSLASEDIHSWRARAELHEALGELERADRSLARALEIDGGNPMLLVARGRLAVTRQAADDVDRCFDLACEAVPGAALLWNARAEALAAQKGRFQEALACFNRAAGMEPWNARHRLDLAAAALRTGDDDAAEHALTETLALELVPPDHETVLSLRAAIAAYRGNRIRTKGFAQDTVATADRAENLAVAAQAAEQVRERATAVAAFLRGLRIEPSRVLGAWKAFVTRTGQLVNFTREMITVHAWTPQAAAGFAAATRAARVVEGWYVFEDDKLGSKWLLGKEGDEEYVLRLERARRPVEGAVVRLMRQKPGRRPVVAAECVTDEDGRGHLEPSELVRDYLANVKKGLYRWSIVFPPEDQRA